MHRCLLVLAVHHNTSASAENIAEARQTGTCLEEVPALLRQRYAEVSAMLCLNCQLEHSCWSSRAD
eukprot:scaffold521325_cov47-Prasinocladus_malaysianus.AAC.1